MPEQTKNFAVSTVATAPSPAISGTSLVVASGEGTRFPPVPFNAVVCPAGAQPTPANAEVIRCTARTTDTFSTIVRAQESSSARTIVVGDRIYAGVTALTLADLEQYTNNVMTLHDLDTSTHGIEDTANLRNLSSYKQAGIFSPSIPVQRSAVALTASRAYWGRVFPTRNMTIATVSFLVTTTGADTACDVGIYTWSGSTLTRVAVATAASGLLNSLGVKTMTLTSPVALTAGTVYYAGFSCAASTTAQILFAFFGVNNAANLFGTALGAVEMVYKATSHPLASSVTTLSTDGSGVPLLALKE